MNCERILSAGDATLGVVFSGVCDEGGGGIDGDCARRWSCGCPKSRSSSRLLDGEFFSLPLDINEVVLCGGCGGAKGGGSFAGDVSLESVVSLSTSSNSSLSGFCMSSAALGTTSERNSKSSDESARDFRELAPTLGRRKQRGSLLSEAS